MATVWYAFILLFLVAYILLDGYDLGAGVISLFTREREARHAIVEEIGTIWDGNEVWLVLLGVGFWSGFPLAFGVILPQLYIPIIVILFALILRGFSVEMISQGGREAKGRWYVAFGIGSLLAAFGQGFALGALTSPIVITNGAYSGSTFDAFSWFSVLTGVTVTLGYVALGYAFLARRGIGDPKDVSRRGRIVSVLAVVAAAVSLIAINATAAPLDLSTSVRAFAFWGLLVFAVVGAVIAIVGFGRAGSASAANPYPFAGLAVTVVAVLGAFAVTHYPLLVPPDLTVQAAAAPPSTLWFLLVAVGLILPVLLFINWFSHSVFSRRVVAPPQQSQERESEGAGHVA